jgi:hypothetical protein
MVITILLQPVHHQVQILWAPQSGIPQRRPPAQQGTPTPIVINLCQMWLNLLPQAQHHHTELQPALLHIHATRVLKMEEVLSRSSGWHVLTVSVCFMSL